MAGSEGESTGGVRAGEAETKLDAECTLRRAIENSIPAGVAATDTEGRQSYVNAAFSRMLGWPEEQLLGAKPPFVYWPEEEIETIRRALETTLGGKAPSGGFELRFQRRNGERFDALVITSPWPDSSGRAAGWVASIWDITERKSAERRLAAEHEVARILGRAASVREAAREVLRALCEILRWEMGAFWLPDPRSGRLHCLETWNQLDNAGEFQRMTRQISFARGEGLPGRAWETGSPVWISNILESDYFQRAAAAVSADLRHGFAFPILLGNDALGAAELFGRAQAPPDTDLARTAGAIGAQIAQFLERKQTEEALRESEQRYRAIVETANEGVWLIDRQGHTLYVNRRMAEMLGYAAEEMAGRPALDFCFPADAAPTLGRILANLGGNRDQFDCRLRRKDGSELLTLACTSPMLDRQGNVVGALGMFSDLTDRGRTEDVAGRLAAIVESSEDAIIGKTLEGVVQTWNSGAERVYGYSSEEAIGRSITFLLPPDRTDEESAILERLKLGERIEHFETVRRRKDGKPIQVSITISPIRDKHGRITGASHVARDITERSLFEERLRETAKLESLGVLAGGVAHDFNNLLVGIMGSASLAMSDLPPSSAARQLIASVLQASEQAANLTRQLLAYSGKGRFVVQPIDLSALIRDIVALIQSSVARTITLRLELQDKLPPIDADIAQIQQLVMNLIINGAEAIGDAPGTVLVRTGIADLAGESSGGEGADLAPGRYVCLEVRDTGCGMDEAVKSRMFDPFFTTKFTGRGLGLAAALGIVRGHRGAIRVESNPGHGSRFTVLLPVARGKIVSPGVKPVGDLSGNGTVLVIDDEEVVRRTAQRALKRYGYEVLLASDGSQAVQLFSEGGRRIDVVLLDLTMPEMSGEQTLIQLKRIHPDVPVILSSGFNELEAVRRFQDRGLAGFLQKPYTAEKLAGKVKSVRENPERRTADGSQ